MMKIYTGQTTGVKLEKILNLDMGVMISSNPNTMPGKDISKTYCALDNGAFSCFRKGYPFMEDVFLKTLSDSYKKNIKLDFIVCPDVVAGGMDSYYFSLKWAQEGLLTAPNLALAVQDGMMPNKLGNLSRWKYIFVGGTKEWKWKTAKMWVDFAHDNGKLCHIGQCGRLEYLHNAFRYDADSVDSTSWTINDSFEIVERFYSEIGYEI